MDLLEVVCFEVEVSLAEEDSEGPLSVVLVLVEPLVEAVLSLEEDDRLQDCRMALQV